MVLAKRTARSLKELLQPWKILEQDCWITGITNDSRQVAKGDLFIACPGLMSNGHEYITEAVNKGAAAVLYQEDVDCVPSDAAVPLIGINNLRKIQGLLAAKFYDYPAQDLRIIGVTGTNGKTSITHFIAQLLEQNHLSCGVMGTLGAGFLQHLEDCQLTTPDAISMQQHFAKIKQQGAWYVAMEVSSHALAQDRISGVKIEVAVFTQLSRDHLDYHGSLQAYGAAKKRLFGLDSVKYCVLNFDDALGREIADEQFGKKQIITYSCEGRKDPRFPAILANHIQLLTAGVSAELETPWGCGHLQAPLLGRFNISNLLAVVGVLGVLHLPWPQILQGLSTIKSVVGRMQVFGGGKLPWVVVDYSHTPDALQKALQVLRDHCQGQLWCVFGCGGDRDAGKRPLMGAIAAQYSDHVVLTNDNPRSEPPMAIVAAIREGMSPSAAQVELNRAKAIAKAVQSAAPADIVLIAGKGHETYQIIGKEKLPFSDIEQVRYQLQQREKNDEII